MRGQISIVTSRPAARMRWAMRSESSRRISSLPTWNSVGGSFDSYGCGEDGRGWVTAAWAPTPMACNPHGIVQAGVHSVLLDALMNFAINSSLDGKDRTRATLEMKTETMRVANAGDDLVLHGEVVRGAKQVAYAEATVRDADGRLVSRATGTFLLHREGD